MRFERRLVVEAKLGNEKLEKIEIEGKILLITYRSQFGVNGYVFDSEGIQKGDYKILKVQKSKNGKYVIAERKKFPLDKIEPVEYNRTVLQNELERLIRLKNYFKEQAQEGVDVGYSIENYEYFIENLEKILSA